MPKKKAQKPKLKPIPYPRLQKEKRVVILFGLDLDEQARGAYFTSDDDAALSRMAKALGMRIGIAVAAHQIALAEKLPKGDLHATGTDGLPRIPLETLEKINATVGGETGVIEKSLPDTWSEIQPGHLVVAQDSLADGWWPAVVVKRHDDKLVMKWRDYPGQGEFIRLASSVALLTSEPTN